MRDPELDVEMSEVLEQIHAEMAAERNGTTVEEELAAVRRKRGGQPGNRNAAKPRDYMPSITPEQIANLEQGASGFLAIEIAVLRALIHAALGFANQTNNSTSYISLMNAITHTTQALARLVQINVDLQRGPAASPAAAPPAVHS